LGVAIAEDISQGTRSYEPDLFLFDNYPGGIGQSQPLFKLTARLLAGALEVIEQCGCEAGCPACVGPAGEIGERGKDAALRLLRELAGVSERTRSVPE
jgi:DEAD/DEAH box helicase domain-containing protein